MDDGSPIPMILCANKADLLTPNSGLDEKTIHEYAISHKFSAGFLCSSKTGTNTNESLLKLVESIMAHNKQSDQLTEDIKKNAIKKLEPKKTKKKKGWC